MKYLKLAFILLLFLVKPISALAYPYPTMLPPPVDIPIPNIPQETDVWCWVAVVQQIVYFKNGSMGTPSQCAMVSISKNVPIQYCCTNSNNCRTTGSLQEIQQLLRHFGGSFSSYSPPANAMALYQTLAQGKPVIMQISTTPLGYQSGMSHVIVIRGMYFQQTPMGVIPMLIINDPLGQFTQNVPFAQLAPLWQAAIVVHN